VFHGRWLIDELFKLSQERAMPYGCKRWSLAVVLAAVVIVELGPVSGIARAEERLRAFDDPQLLLVSSEPECEEDGSLFGGTLFNPALPFALGDGSFRKEVAASGIGYQGSITQFYQGVAHGGVDRTFEYGGKTDQFFNFDGEKLGLWKGFFVSMHSETRFGQDVNFDAVGLAPANANMLYPLPGQTTTAITGLLFTQALSEEWLVSAGKFNLLDLFYQLYPQTGRGIDGFMNISSILPISSGLGLNLSIVGVGVTKMKDGKVEGSFSVLDTNNSTTTTGINDLYNKGVTMVGFYRLFTNFFDLPGSHGVMGVYSNSQYTSVDPLTWAFIPNVGIVAGKETGTWNVAYLGEQKLWVDSKDPNRNVGLFSTWGLSDGNPNPIRWTGMVSIQGQGFNDLRPLDAVGASFFYTGLSSDFQRLASPLVKLQNPYGGEVYYNAAVTPWFHLTGDLQVINPGESANDTAVVVGLRAKLSL
jgi:porin